MTIRVFELMENTDAVLGTQDGNVFAQRIADILTQEKEVQLDFSAVISFSNSASCAFWGKLVRLFGKEVVERLSFTSMAPSVLESLEYGVAFVTDPNVNAKRSA